MTKYTSPFGTEHERFGTYFLDKGFKQDPHGNYVLDVGKSDTIFAAHLDTADRTTQRVRRVVKGNLVKTDGTTILGADNRAGIAVLLHLLRHGVPGRYMLFVGEESGRIGSTLAAKDGAGDGYQRIICWDRMGDDSLITHQMGERSCSDDFAEALAAQYNLLRQYNFDLKPDDGGTYTDSYSFYDYIPECTNISIGYMFQHTTSEEQDLQFLVDMAEASVLVDWEGLPTAQDQYNRESQWYSAYGNSKGWKPWDDEDEYFFRSEKEVKDSGSWLEGVDEEFMLAAANRNMLTYTDVEDWVFSEPENAAKLLHKLLKG